MSKEIDILLLRKLVSDRRFDESKVHRDPDGKFASGGGGSSGKKTKTPPLDTKGERFTRPRKQLPPKEYGKVMRDINKDFDRLFEGKEFCAITTVVKIKGKDTYATYFFENHGFDDYNVYRREVDK